MDQTVNKKIRLGILGYGFMGQTHAKNVAAFDDIELVAICDNNPAQLEDVTEGCFRIYHTAEEIIADPDIDWLLVATPNNLHCAHVVAAANAGKHILCEKPVAMTLEQFDTMLDACSKNKVHFTIHQQRRFDKDFCTAKKVYDDRMVGDDMFIIKSQLYGVNGRVHDWHVYPEFGGGMLFDWGVHLIDQMLYMIPSRVKSLYANVRNVMNEQVDDYFKIELLFENGQRAEIELGTYYLTPTRAWFIGGNTGSMVIDGFKVDGNIVRTTRLLENVPGQITMTAAGPTRSFGPPEPGVLQYEPLPEVEADHSMFMQNLLDAWNGKTDFLVKPEETRRVLALMDAARESARTGTSISFE